MKKHICIMYICLFFVLFLLPTLIFGVFESKIDQENFEKRKMAQKPDLTIDTIEKFPKEYENYYNDNLPFRSQLIRANGLIDFKLFGQSPVDRVIVGKEGWLFYNPPIEDSQPIAQCTGLKMSEEDLKQTAENLLLARQILAEQNIKLVVLVAPNKESIYGQDYLPQSYNAKIESTMADQVVDYIKQNTDINIVYPKNEILNAIKQYPQYDFYYKLDTHWNSLGGYIGAKELLNALDIQSPSFNELNITSKQGGAGDLSDMTGLPDMFNYHVEYTVNNYSTNSVAFDNSHEKIDQYSTKNADPRSVLVVRDSFATALQPFLNTQFNNTNYVHITSYYPSVIEDCKPDVVVLQVVERYIDRLRTFKLK